MADETYDVHVVRELDGPVERVWQAWTRAEDLRRWWGPTGFTCPRAEVDLREGGRILVTMRAPDEWGGAEFHNSWALTRVEPPVRLAYVHRFANTAGEPITPAEAGIPADGVPVAAEHEVTLAGLPDGRTRLEVVEHGYTSTEARDMSRAGLEQCLDKMAVLVAEGTAAPAPGTEGSPAASRE